MMKLQINADEHGCRDWAECSIDELIEAVIGGSFRVHNALGCGFLEKVYENALTHELRKTGLKVVQQAPLTVTYDGIVVGDYSADLYVESRLVLELKTTKGINDIHLAQTLNYLRATDHRVALIFNFARPRLEFKRVVNNY